ncbi:conserved membrane hypothetical protein [uncultured Desulfobacterium sp.]|uniref:ABC transporter permease n=1 Tax=uncultured Desulfobacterium sp. TaxID=201089 RepID=A0A445MVA3_9BACT|nr:conserved membrane hypothetical protein [uncultured Desulfobacterium sp.]
MINLIRIAFYTIKDQMRQKSFYLLLAVAVLFILLIRSCYHGDYSVNGQKLDNVSVAWHASLLVFHVIAGGMFLMTSMLSMGVFSRDSDDGSLVMFLSRPVGRWQYVLGRILGIWLLSTAFMFVLHLTIFIIVFVNTGGMITGYLTASLLCSINLLFAIVLTCFLSLILPNFMSAIFTIIIIAISFISDGAYQAMHSTLVRMFVSGEGTVATWRIYYPKVYMVQNYASTLISNKQFEAMGETNLWLNMGLYTTALAAIMLLDFSRREI